MTNAVAQAETLTEIEIFQGLTSEMIALLKNIEQPTRRALCYHDLLFVERTDGERGKCRFLIWEVARIRMLAIYLQAGGSEPVKTLNSWDNVLGKKNSPADGTSPPHC